MLQLLANGLSKIGEVTIIILCVLVVLFVIVDAILVISLHRQNKKLENSPPPEKEQTQIENKEE